MATPVEEQREIEVLEWDEASNSFTTAGDTSPDLDRLRRDWKQRNITIVAR
jgi:hypothetical protein